MTMEALAVAIRCVQPNGRWRRRFAKILHVHVSHASPFGTYATVEYVVGVTRVAGFVDGNPVVLKVSRRDIMTVIHVKTFPNGSMMWHERQNVVVFERSMCAENPTALHNSGKRKSATKARIFPSRVDVSAGRATKRAAKPRPSKNKRSASLSGVNIDFSHASIHVTSHYSRAYRAFYFASYSSPVLGS